MYFSRHFYFQDNIISHGSSWGGSMDMGSFLGIIANVATIVGLVLGLITIIIALWQYKRNQLNSKKQVLSVLKSQLKVSKNWAGTRGPGYTGEPSEKNKIERADPFYNVLTIENAPGTIVLGVKEIASFGENFIDSLLHYNQTIQSMKDMQALRDGIAFSDIRSAIKIKVAVTGLISKYRDESFEHFLSNSNFADEEKLLAQILSGINVTLHWKLIGTVGGNGLHESQNNMEKEVELAGAKLDCSWFS